MNFHSLKRKDLQALCKKHNLPANSTNLEMADKLTSLLKEGEKTWIQGGSRLKRKDEKVRANDSDVETRQFKKSKLNLENQSIEFVNSGGSISKTGSRVRSVEKNVDISESSKRILEKTVRARRSRLQKSVEGDLVMDSNPPVEKKRGRRAVKDVNTTTDKPPLPPPLPPPTDVELSDNAASEEPRLPKRRSMRKSPNPCVEKKRERRPAKDVNTSDKPPLPPPMPPPPLTVAELSGNAANEEPELPKRRPVRKSGVVVGGEVPIPNHSVEKKRERKAVKDLNTSDKPPLQRPVLPSPPPAAAELSNNEDEEPGLPKRRSLRKREVVEGGEVPIPNPFVERKRERKVAKDVNTSDKPPPMQPPQRPVGELSGNAANEELGLPKRRSVRKRGEVKGGEVPIPISSVEKRERMESKDVETSDNAAAEETRKPKRRLLRNREVSDFENLRSPMPSKSVSKIRKPLQPLPTNIGFGTPNLVAVKDVEITSRRCNAAAKETTKATRRSLRNKENVVDIVVSRKNTRKTVPNKRNANDSDEVAKKEASEATIEIIQPEKSLKQKEANAEESYLLELGKNEKVKRPRVTRSRTQASTVDGEIRSEKVLQLEEPLQHKRRNANKRKCDENVEEVDIEKSLKGYIRNCREYDLSLHFANQAGDIGSSNLIDSVSRVGRARGGVVFWCNGSGCFALPKW